MGKSFAMGNGLSESGPGSPAKIWQREGWDVRPVTSWTLTIGQDPA